MRQKCRKGSFSMKIVATDGNCYRTLLLVILISPAWIVYSHWPSSQWFQLTDVHPCSPTVCSNLQPSGSSFITIPHLPLYCLFKEKMNTRCRQTHDTLHRPLKYIRNIICSCWHTEFRKPSLQAFSGLFDHLPPLYRLVLVTCPSAVCSMKELKFPAQSRS